jgi:hypothetical protein
MNPQEPVIPDPDSPSQDPNAPVSDPSRPDEPGEYQAENGDELDAYDRAEAESFPASDPPSASEPGV